MLLIMRFGTRGTKAFVSAIEFLDFGYTLPEAADHLNQSIINIADICDDSSSFISICTCISGELDCVLTNFHDDLEENLRHKLMTTYEFKTYGDM